MPVPNLTTARAAASALALAALSTPALGATLASQDFSNNGVVQTAPVNAGGSAATANGQVGTGAFPGTFSDPGASGLGWVITGGPFDADDDSDLLGVVDIQSTAHANQSIGFGGSAIGPLLYFDEPDTTTLVTFDAVDTTGATDLALSFDFAISSTSWETNDGFEVSVNNQTVFSRFGAALPGEFGTSETLQGVDIDLSAFDGQSSLLVVLSFVSNNTGEDFALDNFALTAAGDDLPGGGGSNVVPLPAPAFLLLGALGLMGCYRKQRGGTAGRSDG